MTMTLTVFLVSLLAVMALGIPIAFALIMSGIALLIHMGMYDTQILAANLIDGADNFPLMAIAFFILAGELMNAGGISKRIIAFAVALVGHVRGGLGYVAIIASLIFSGLSGSAVADTAALGAVLIPIMAEAGYDRAKSAALIASAGIIAPIMPLSVPMIIFGVTGNVSIPKLFMSGIVPGLLLCFFLAATWAWIVRKERFQVQPRKSFAELLKAARGALWAFILPAIIIVGLRGGVFTPTEAASIAAFYALFVGVVVYRELTLHKIIEALVMAAKTTSIIMFLAAAAMVSSWLIAVANIPAQIAQILAPVMENKIMLMFAINVVVLLVGTAMDATPTILILTPVLMPIIQKAGIDPIYFGFMFVFNNMIGLLTPPVGTVLNVAAGVGKVSMDAIIKGVMPYMWVEILLLLLLTFFPQLVLVPLSWFIGS
ncbi:TRAP dicarboxylate transporter, DctM subunit [Thermosinus carboxydivorans Nor1]|uniref:TRAP dicarboxylate transporter, DctM subunit n=1 Tax=Thermosinus carboxydivorans Nor1 TaxID=401526 RepID=A1HSP9_9FIRM|nr:TRAP transporter large permease subunit [Thermosinus carboxydivorans]EAX46930.1 TRAP dicarboxylate transporter, DctM subunit [Thermosinus carboxydivorans Nor1]